MVEILLYVMMKFVSAGGAGEGSDQRHVCWHVKCLPVALQLITIQEWGLEGGRGGRGRGAASFRTPHSQA